MSKILVLLERSFDGNTMYRVDVEKLQQAFLDSVDMEVLLEGIESGDSVVTLESVDKREIVEAFRSSMEEDGYTELEIQNELSKL